LTTNYQEVKISDTRISSNKLRVIDVPPLRNMGRLQSEDKWLMLSENNHRSFWDSHSSN